MIYYADKKLLRKISYKELDRIVIIGYQYLGINEKIILEIGIDEELSNTIYGEADIEDGNAKIFLSPRIPSEEIPVTIFHEFVHIDQMLKKRLVIGEGLNKSTWYGRTYDKQYCKLPWEIEAYALETEMMKMFRGEQK